MLQPFRTLLTELESEPTGPRFQWRWVIVPAVILAVATVFVRLTGFDLHAQQAIYRAGQGSWKLGDHPFWKSLYDLGTIPTMVIIIAALIMFFLSWSREALRRWRRVFIYLLSVAAVGPGIITNGILKEYWGRPRPREVQGLGGHNAFEEILTLDLSSAGKSFPCGHATMGFYFLCGFFLLRRYRKSWANSLLIGALILGCLIGIARMLQGAHFFSDMIWAGAVCWYTALGLFYALKLDRGVVKRGLAKGKMPLRTKLVAGVLGLGLFAGIFLASPYRDIRNYYIVNDFAKVGPINLRLKFVAGEIKVVPGEVLRIEGEAYGHGIPTSSISESYREINEGEFTTIAYVERMSGFLTEANQYLTVTVPWDRIHHFRLEVEDAKVRIQGAHLKPEARLQIAGGNGDITFIPSPGNWAIRDQGSAEVLGKEYLEPVEGERMILTLMKEFEGRFEIESASGDSRNKQTE